MLVYSIKAKVLNECLIKHSFLYSRIFLLVCSFFFFSVSVFVVQISSPMTESKENDIFKGGSHLGPQDVFPTLFCFLFPSKPAKDRHHYSSRSWQTLLELPAVHNAGSVPGSCFCQSLATRSGQLALTVLFSQIFVHVILVFKTQ